MKKNCKFLILLTLIFFVFLLGGCHNDDSVVDIKIKDNSIDNPFEIEIGEHKLDEYILLVEYESGNIVETDINENMILESEMIKFYKIGSQEVTIKYERKSVIMYVRILSKNLEDIYLEDLVVEYSGDFHEVTIKGNVPQNAVIIYPYGNKFKNAGVYDIKAVVYVDEYNILELNSQLTINKSKYDLSNINFEDKTVVYNGQPQQLVIDGDLPNGVNVKYEYSGNLTNAGVYEITAIFSCDLANYEPIPNMQATLTIAKANYNLEGINFFNDTFVYDGSEYGITISNPELLPKGVTVTYENNYKINVGTYEVIANFSGDSNNYNEIPSMFATMTIKKAKYDLDNIIFEGGLYTYDGNKKIIAIEGKLPEGVEVKYEIYDENDELLEDFPSEDGIYIVYAKFTHSNPNYEEISDMIAIIIIES